MKILPTDLPRSMISFACAFWFALTEERFTFAAALPEASSGCGTAEGVCEPFCPSPFIRIIFPPATRGREFGLSGAPHSSQYWAPSRFSVLHRSHVIMFFGGFAARTLSALNSQV